MTHKICSTSVASCTTANVFNALTKNAALGADGKTSETNETQTSIEFLFISGGTVRNIVDFANLRVINWTNRDHIFFDGYAIRSVVQEEGIISIRTYGEGINRPADWSLIPNRASWAMNYVLNHPGFSLQDARIRNDAYSHRC